MLLTCLSLSWVEANQTLTRWFQSRLFTVSNPREIWLITAAHGINEFYSIALPPILPLLVSNFGVSYAQIGALLTIFYATYSIFQLPMGMLADRIGQRRLLAGGMIMLSAGIMIAAGAQDYWMLIGAQVFAGIGGSTYHPSGMSLISDLETGDTEGKAMGIHGFGGIVGTALAPALIGGLAALFDWRFALVISGLVGIIYTAIFLVLFRDVTTTGTSKTTDSTNEKSPVRDGENSSLSLDNALSNIRRHISILLEWWVGVLFFANLAIGIETGAVRTFVTSYLVNLGELRTGTANAIFFIMLIGAGVASLGGGFLADVGDRRRLGVVAMLGSGIVLSATWLVPVIPVILAVWFFLLGIILWVPIPLMNALTSQYSEREFSGSLFGVLITASTIGHAVGPLLFGVLAERFGFISAFPLISVVSIAGAAAFLGMYRV